MFFSVLLFQTANCFIGNRTHYPNNQIRNDSEIADVNYATSTGSIRIPIATRNVPNEALRSFQNEFLDVDIEYQIVPRNLLSQLRSACETKSGDFDVMILDATQIGQFQDCFVDLWAYNFDMGREMNSRFLYNGISNDRLLALPFEIHQHVLIYNKKYLTSHGWDSMPRTMNELERMLEDIIVNERGAENFQLVGISYPGVELQEMISAVAEWSTAVSSVIIGESKKYSLATSAFTDVVAQIVKWKDLGYVEFDDVDTTDEVAWTKFLRRQSIFVHTSTRSLMQIDEVPFEYAVTGFPTIGQDLLRANLTMPLCVRHCDGIARNGTFTGTVSGLYMGVYKYSKNLSVAVKAVERLTSKDYQKQMIPTKEYERQYVSPAYVDLPLNVEFCEPLDQYGLCEYYRDSIPSVRPSTLAQNLYPNVTEIVNVGMKSIFMGEVDVSRGVDIIDAQLRSLLGIAAFNSTEEDPFVIAKPKQRFKNMGTQLIILMLVIGFLLSMVFLYRRKMIQERQAMETARLTPLKTVIDHSVPSTGNPDIRDSARLLIPQ